MDPTMDQAWWLGPVGVVVIGWLGRKSTWGNLVMALGVFLFAQAYRRHLVQQAVEKSFALLD